MPTLATTLADRPADLIRDLLHRALAQFVVDGTLRVTFADGRIEAYGNGTPTAHIALRDRGAELGLLLHPELRLGEAYMDGTLEVVAGDTYDLLRLVLANRNRGRLPAPIRTLSGLASRLRPDRLNDALRSRRNVAHHYDLDGRLYDLFLDADLRQYSCAYFERPDMGLAAAQRAKIARIARKLRASPGQTALDIGCGWGGMATHLARAEGLRVT
ncbi:MAG: class I SAM-dependent methyltransferase, partial [Pseudomonadota bacterium]